VTLAFKKINNDEMFHCVPVKPGDKSICLGLKSYRDPLQFCGHEVEITKIDGSQYSCKIDTKETFSDGTKIYKHIENLSNVVTKDWFQSNHAESSPNSYRSFWHKTPNLTQTKISKHFRRVQPGEMDLLCNIDHALVTNNPHFPRIYYEPQCRVMFLKSETRTCTKQELIALYQRDLGKHIDKYSSPREINQNDQDFIYFVEGNKNTKLTFSSFLVGDRKETIDNYSYNHIANNYKDYSGPSAKLFESWIVHDGNIYVSKNRKMK